MCTVYICIVDFYANQMMFAPAELTNFPSTQRSKKLISRRSSKSLSSHTLLKRNSHQVPRLKFRPGIPAYIFLFMSKIKRYGIVHQRKSKSNQTANNIFVLYLHVFMSKNIVQIYVKLRPIYIIKDHKGLSLTKCVEILLVEFRA